MPFGIGQNTQRQRTTSAGHAITLLPARVVAVILDNTTYPDLFKKYGEWASIGGIVFEYTENATFNKTLNNQQFALPLLPNLKHYPVKNEVVSIMVSPDPSVNQNTTSFTYYYLPPTNIWSSSHHNAIPDEIFTDQNLQQTQKKDYQEVGQGSVRRVSDGSTEIQFDNGFQERSNIRPLAPFAGDVIVEGRWGNSIRVGSTNSSGLSNTWSSTGQEGDPILILRNGQYEDSQPAWVNISEDINKDGASMYLTSTQKINLTPARANYQSYPTSTQAPGEYTKNQIILNSGRIVLNSSSDHLLLSANKSINFNAVENIVADSAGQVTLKGSKVNLGVENATEPVLRGNQTSLLLTDLLTNLSAFMTIMQTVPTPGLEPVKAAAAQMIPKLTQLITDINTPGKIKSNKTFTA